MESVLRMLQQVFNQLTLENILVSIVLLSLFFLLRIYLLSKEKKKLKELINNKIKMFQKAFDISEDAI